MTLIPQVLFLKEARKARREGREVGRIAARDDCTCAGPYISHHSPTYYLPVNVSVIKKCHS